MLRHLLHPVVEHLCPNWPVLSSPDRIEVVADTSRHVSETVAGAPLVLKVAISALAMAFRAAAVVHGRGRGFARQDSDRREEFLRWWCARGTAARSFERLVRSVTILAALEHPLAKRAMGLESDTVRRAARRRDRQRWLRRMDRTVPAGTGPAGMGGR